MLIPRPARLIAPLLLAVGAKAATVEAAAAFPRDLASYPDAAGGIADVLRSRLAAEPFNLVATAIFVLAVVHTFLAPRIRHWGLVVEQRHRAKMVFRSRAVETGVEEVSFGGQVLHFFGEIEAVFGIWAVVLAAAIAGWKGPGAVVAYLDGTVNFTEPMFVVVIMAIASTRPIMRLAEQCLHAVAALGGGRPAAWWFSILTLAPLFGSLITEPAAMTIAALLLGKRFYALQPSNRLKYATLGLLFVNISIGGTLTHFAAPPVLMVAARWGWNTTYMLTHFGWHAVLSVVASNVACYLVFRKELRALDPAALPTEPAGRPVPVWVTGVHVLFLGYIMATAHHPVLFLGGFLFFLAFSQATAHHQSRLDLRGPLLVGFFLAGLVIHGGLQGWWIQPVLGGLGKVTLFFGAALLTAFNDNALITYLATLVPGFTEELKYAVVAGAVTGGGLTVIANAPNPAGQSILQRYFPEGSVSPLGLFLGALGPTLLVVVSFIVL